MKAKRKIILISVISIIILLSQLLHGQEKVKIKDQQGNSLIEINDEGTFGSIYIPDSAAAPGITTNKLYNVGGVLNFNGAALGSGGASVINDLGDAKSIVRSIYIGQLSGDSDNGHDNQNTAIGYSALKANSSGIQNVSIGETSMLNNSTGKRNTVVGQSALRNNTSGSWNTVIGEDALFHNIFGHRNVAIGSNAGFGSSGNSASGNIFLGYKAGYFETGSNKLYIENSNSSAPLIWGDFANDIAAINGKLGVGTQSPSDRMQIKSQSGENPLRVQVGSSTKMRVLANGGTSIGTNNTSTTPDNGLYVHGDTKINGALVGNVQVGTNGTPFTEIIKLTGTLSDNSDVTSFNYPAGFNQENTFVVAAKLKANQGSQHYYHFSTSYAMVYKKYSVVLGGTLMSIRVVDNNLRGGTYKMVLMKMD